MSGKLPVPFYNISEDLNLVEHKESDKKDDEVDSIGNDSMRVNLNATASDVLSLDDNNSVSQIDPGNFSESDIEEDVSSNCALSFSDVLGGFPESDIEEEGEQVSDAGISFNSDLGSPMHSSCRSYPVSEDRDDREEATPLPLHASYQSSESKICQPSSQGKSVDYETYNESETSAPDAAQKRNETEVMCINPRRLRNSTISKRKLTKSQAPLPNPKRSHRLSKKVEKPGKKASLGGKRKALSVMRLMSDDIMPTLTPYYSIPSCASGKEGSGKSLNIPILDLCITEDEGYLGMAEETSESDKDENHLPVCESLSSTN